MIGRLVSMPSKASRTAGRGPAAARSAGLQRCSDRAGSAPAQLPGKSTRARPCSSTSTSQPTMLTEVANSAAGLMAGPGRRLLRVSISVLLDLAALEHHVAARFHLDLAALDRDVAVLLQHDLGAAGLERDLVVGGD